MVDLQGLHLRDALQHLNISASVGLKSFYQWSLIRLLSLSVYILDKTGTAENKVKSL